MNKPTARYYYEGQMGIEEDYTREIEESMETDVTRYGLGARGNRLFGGGRVQRLAFGEGSVV
ncbi:MAG: hypothetical protein K8H99_01555 [Nitrospirae bacterium]|nr:hypothetical protein [Fimbriimonadaceae bacterium]